MFVHRSTPVNDDGTDNPLNSNVNKGRDYGIGLPGRQLDLLKSLANSTDTTIVLVVMSGSAVEVRRGEEGERTERERERGKERGGRRGGAYQYFL